jgi:hypothetical protein
MFTLWLHFGPQNLPRQVDLTKILVARQDLLSEVRNQILAWSVIQEKSYGRISTRIKEMSKYVYIMGCILGHKTLQNISICPKFKRRTKTFSASSEAKS